MAANAALGEVLEFLFGANIEATDAFATAKVLMEHGISSRAAILSLTPERAKELAPKKVHRKLLSAVKKGDTRQPATPEAKRVCKEEPEPAPPTPPAGPCEDVVVVINRSPVMVLWGACLAHLEGYTWAEALSLGSAAAAQMARAKGASIGLYSTAPPTSTSEDLQVGLLGSKVPAVRTRQGVRGLSPKYNGAADFDVTDPAVVHRSMARAFSEHYGAVHATMASLAGALPASLRVAGLNRVGYELYKAFRPHVPDGAQGWGQPGRLELRQISALRARYEPACGTAGTASSSSSGVPTLVKREPTAAVPDGVGGTGGDAGAGGVVGAGGGGAMAASPAAVKVEDPPLKSEATPVKLEPVRPALAATAASAAAVSSTLSPEQLARIAANREAALARRRAAQEAAAQGGGAAGHGPYP